MGIWIEDLLLGVLAITVVGLICVIVEMVMDEFGKLRGVVVLALAAMVVLAIAIGARNYRLCNGSILCRQPRVEAEKP